MLILDRLKEKEDFSDSEKKIADYILAHASDVIEMTIYELSDKTYASTSTITRFCRKLEVDGFSDFKLSLAKELSTFSLSDSRIAQDTPFSKGDMPQDIARNIMNLNIQSMLDTYNNLDIEQLLRISQEIIKQNHINVYGRGQSLILCEELQYKLFRIGIDVSVVTQDGFQIMKSHAQKEDSLAIMISYYGVSRHNLEIIKTLHNRKVKTILITGPNKNPLVPYADEVVHIPSQEKLMEKMASYSSRAAMQLVIDILYALVFSLDYDKNLDHIKLV